MTSTESTVSTSKFRGLDRELLQVDAPGNFQASRVVTLIVTTITVVASTSQAALGCPTLFKLDANGVTIGIDGLRKVVRQTILGWISVG